MQQVLESQINPLKLIEVSGNPRERGFQCGIQLKNMIRRLLKEEFYDPLVIKDNISKEALLNYGRKHIPYIEEYSPESLETIKGIAEGSDSLVEEIALIQTHEETRAPKEVSPLYREHCTSFGCTGPATVGGETYTGQNWDFPMERRGGLPAPRETTEWP